MQIIMRAFRRVHWVSPELEISVVMSGMLAFALKVRQLCSAPCSDMEIAALTIALLEIEERSKSFADACMHGHCAARPSRTAVGCI